MNKVLIAFVAAILAAGMGAADASGTLVAPPALHLPYGAKILTDINFSNDDVLGIVKDLLPTLGDLAAVGAAAGGPMIQGGKSPIAPEALAKLDFKPLAEAIEGVRNIRFIRAQFRSDLPMNTILGQFDSGAAKSGATSKIITDFGFMPGALAVYAEPEGAGYIFYNYDSKQGNIYAARLVGKIDVGKLVKWIGDTAKLFISRPARESADESSVEEADHKLNNSPGGGERRVP